MKALKVVIFSAMLLILFGIGFFGRDILAGNGPDVSAFKKLQFKPETSAENPIETFQNHYNYIYAKNNSNVAPDKLRYAAMSGLVSSLGDPHTNFLEPELNKRFNTETSGNYSGIGARLQEDPLGAKIAVVFRNSPAQKAGIKEGDIISVVDGKQVGGQEVDKIVEKILGPSGTNVKLGIVRQGTPGTINLSITRKTVEIPTVESKMLAGNIAYIGVSGFSEITPLQFEEAVYDFDLKNPKGLIIDMRGNPGGLLDAAVKMLSLFVEDKPAVTIKARDNKSVTLSTMKGKVIAGNYPITILINEESASAAEIFAGVMRDYGRAQLIGMHTYGKASVQELRPLPAGASAKITIAKYFLPSTGDISRKVDDDGAYLSGGIAPDIESEIPKGIKDFKFAEPTKDPQLDKAIEYITRNHLN